MDVNVRIVLVDDEPVVVKSGRGPAAARLRLEHERLERARHPGVVTVVGPLQAVPSDERPDGDEHTGAEADAGADREVELRTAYAGEPVARWTGDVAAVAGLGAAVASTLADLHDLGIVHGRLDAGHILIGDDGRPRLCGFAEPGAATPADDVAALTAVLVDLVDRVPPARRGALPWWRASGAPRALRQVVERAGDPVPTRRPTARALAEAILAAVPSADLPAPQPRRRRAPAAVGASADDARTPGSAQPDTLDRIWAIGDQASDDERWARALGPGPRDLPHDVTHEQQASTEETPPLPIAIVDTPAWGSSGVAEHGDQPAEDPWLEATHDPAAIDRVDAWPPDGAYGDEPPRGRASDGHAASWPPEPAAGDDRTRDHRAVGGRVAPRARRPTPEHDVGREARRRRRVALAAACVAVVAAGAGGLALVGAPGDASGADAGADGSGRARDDCPAVERPAADVDGDGCRERLAVQGTTVDAGVAQWSLGEPGDVVAVGDWDCDGDASAVVLRPSTGDVFLFASWAASGEPVTVRSTRRVPDGVAVRAEPNAEGCDRLLVDTASGGTTVVEAAGGAPG